MPAMPPIDGRETRAVPTSLELRDASQGDIGTASGYAVLFGVDANIYDLWVEHFEPGAFTKSLRERDVIALHSHDIARIVGRKNAGTLDLREDARGLAFDNRLPDTSDGRDLSVQIGRGDIAGMSFGFRATKQSWDDTANPPKRTIIEAELYEITYSADPAYPETEVGMRSLEKLRDERREHNKAAAGQRIAARRARQAQIERNLK